MPNIGPAELIVILLVALVVFGPRKLPELGKSLGHGLREFRKSTQGLKAEFDGASMVTTPAIEPVTAAQPPAAPISAAAVIPQRSAEA